VQVDSDRAAIDRWALSTVGVVGDAALVANQFVDRLTELGTPPSKFAAEAVSYRPPAASVEVPSDGDSPGLVAVLEMLDQRLPAERTLVLDGGRFVYMAFTALRVPDPLAYVHTLHFGSIGLGMGNAVGAALARPGRMVLHVCGDGGFMLGGLNEFSSAVRHGLDIVTVVLNDGAYGAEHLQFVAKDIDPSLSCFEWPSFAEMAEVMGGTGYTVNSVKDLERTLAELSERTGPALIDVRLDPYQVPHPGK
jgi:thiamine pyrophosphate-dependent acetolactate synthase large subunit-like protein